jgi:prefoldin subunit 5
MAANTTALAVIVAQFQPVTTQVEHLQSRVNTLSEATSVLAATLERHEDWHSRQTHPLMR